MLSEHIRVLFAGAMVVARRRLLAAARGRGCRRVGLGAFGEKLNSFRLVTELALNAAGRRMLGTDGGTFAGPTNRPL